MESNSVSVHAHRLDADAVIEEYRLKGYSLHERTKPTIAAQPGFERLVFVPTPETPSAPPAQSKPATILLRDGAVRLIGQLLR